MKIYNTLTRSKEELTAAAAERTLTVYACGPTVYNYIHIGNARPLCVFDVLRRWLEHEGYTVRFVQNFTDIDDKLIRRAAEEDTTVPELAERYIKEFETDAAGLNIRPDTLHPRATENIDAILTLIDTLVEKGFAYQSGGDVYFRAARFDGYGKLSHQPLDELVAGARINPGEAKESPSDFALWKAAKPGEPFWPSAYGDGRPGWHIECSAMAGRFLGKTVDIHCGGQDLIFPHHENEIAQSECANGCDFARYWMHNGYINVDNKKMSKSEGNFFTVREVAERYGYEPIRYFMLAAHYRSPINYTPELIEQSKSALERLYTCRRNLEHEIAANVQSEENAALTAALPAAREAFGAAMEDDLNTADALAAVFDLVRACNTAVAVHVPATELKAALALLDELCGLLGLLETKADDSLDAEVEGLIARRAEARAAKNWAEADLIRDHLNEMGIELEDTPSGIKWRKR